ncbi:MAG: ABC transporter permease [Chitinophagales bacterium]|nr:ABC transporter permease [Chitinophagales bacterium]
MSKKKYPINTEVAYTYIVSNKRLTMVAALGVTLGIAVFIFMNSMLAGFDKSSSEAFFKSIPHIRIYKDDEISKPIDHQISQNIPVIINPKVVPANNTIINPKQVIQLLKNQPDVAFVTPQLTVGVFYNNAKTQISGRAIGILPEEANQMFNMESYVVEGNVNNLKNNINGILLGAGVASKMNVKQGDNISITSSIGMTKVMKVIGVFQTNNSVVDKTTAYINIAFAQQLLKKNASYITDINVNIKDYTKAKAYAVSLAQLTNYKAEDWETANETYMAATKMRAIIIRFVSISILLVAGFGIYNILNMTVMQKINDIAILKAIGFNGFDVVSIFVSQALIIGLIGIVFGVLFASVMVASLQSYYVGGDIGYFPIYFKLSNFIKGVAFGFGVTFLAGFIPARKAANVDPVSIFRK